MNEQYSSFSPVVPKIVAIIVDWNMIEMVRKIVDVSYNSSVHIINGMGTGRNEFLEILGVGNMEKAIMIYMQPKFNAQEILRTVSYSLSLKEAGRGIAFTLPLSGVSYPIFRLFNEERLLKLVETLEPEKKELVSEMLKKKDSPDFIAGKWALERMKSNMETQFEKPPGGGFTHDLILAVINHGYSDDLMDAAKLAGAKGGTIIHARGTGQDETVKFFGISLQAEKEIVLIVTERENKKAIMKAISHSCGITTPAGGIVISVPVDGVAGIAGITTG